MTQGHSKTAGNPERDEAGTPDDLFKILDDAFCFVKDLAASKKNTKCHEFFSIENSALENYWPDWGWSWLNPPFSQVEAFTKKARHEWYHNDANSLVLLPGNRCDYRWFDEGAGAANIVHVQRWKYADTPKRNHGRVEYLPPEGIEYSSAGFGSMLLVYGTLTEAKLAALHRVGAVFLTTYWSP